jgi:hypothetical protein
LWCNLDLSELRTRINKKEVSFVDHPYGKTKAPGSILSLSLDTFRFKKDVKFDMRFKGGIRPLNRLKAETTEKIYGAYI